ncbi:hypothetical protein [Streptomyces sp. NPDC056690]|uniref:hypothetical protein n=1 Tax=unclassified Streptomyces TaxID=2593676 RepID=UPI003628A5C0
MPGAVVRGLDHLVTRPDLMRLRLWKLLERPTVIAHEEEPHSGPLKTAEGDPG